MAIKTTFQVENCSEYVIWRFNKLGLKLWTKMALKIPFITYMGIRFGGKMGLAPKPAPMGRGASRPNQNVGPPDGPFG